MRLLLPFLLALLMTSSAYTQPVGALHTTWRIMHGDDLRDEARTYRVYGMPDQLLLALTMTNEAAVPVILTQSQLHQDITVRVSAVTDVPIVAEWENGFNSLLGRTSVQSNTEVRLDPHPHQGLQWIVRLRRADKLPFPPGKYTISVSVRMSGARRPDGLPWQERILFPTASLFVITGPPDDNAAERSAAHRQVGNRAIAEGRFVDALAAFRLAVTADPTDVGALTGLGRSHLRLNQYREAIPVLEQAFALMPSEPNPIPTWLATAYLGVGEQPNAERVLRTAGFSEARIPEEISRLREQITRKR